MNSLEILERYIATGGYRANVRVCDLEQVVAKLKLLQAVAEAAKQLRDYTKTWDYYRGENPSREETDLDAALAALGDEV